MQTLLFLGVREAADQFLISHDPNRLVESTSMSPYVYHTIVLEHPDTNNFLYAMDALPGDYAAKGHTIKVPEEVSKRLPSADRIGNLYFDLLNASQGVGTPNFPPDQMELYAGHLLQYVLMEQVMFSLVLHLQHPWISLVYQMMVPTTTLIKIFWN